MPQTLRFITLEGIIVKLTLSLSFACLHCASVPAFGNILYYLRMPALTPRRLVALRVPPVGQHITSGLYSSALSISTVPVDIYIKMGITSLGESTPTGSNRCPDLQQLSD